MNPVIQSVSINGSEIQRVIFDRLAPAIEGEDLSTAVVSLLTFSVLMMKPNIEFEQLYNTVMSVSEHLIMCIADTPAGEAN